MKHLIFILTIIVPITIWAQLERLQIENTYENNILSLSDYLSDQFLDNNNPEKHHINSKDDWITSASMRLGWRHYIKKHTQIIRINAKYSKYWNNSIKDNGYVGINIRQYFSPKFNVSVYYYYYPEIYVNHYRPVLLPNDYKEFTYAKNSYFSIFSLRVTKQLEMRYRFDFDQLFYSKYFTEYDAENFTQELESRYKISSKIRFSASYAYRISNAQAEKAYQNITITDYKDPSYTQNRYKVGITIYKLPFESYMNIGFSYYEKYYDSPFPENTYHYKRDEFYKQFQFSVTTKISKEIQLQPLFEYQLRTVRSPFSSVVRDKEYDNWKAGLQISYYP